MQLRRFFAAGTPRVSARLARAGWRPTSRWDWDLYWRPQVPSLAAYASLRPGMRVNHLPGIGVLTSARLLREAEQPGDGRLARRFVLISGVDPLRVYTHGAGADLGPAIEAQLQRMIMTTVLAARDALTRATRDLLADRDACFELLAFDFRIDASGRPWLVRCVLSPTVDASPQVVDDTLALLGLLPEDATRYAGGDPGDREQRWQELASTELARRGRYVRLAPAEDPAWLLSALPLPRRSDLVLAEQLSPGTRFEPRIVPRAASRFVAGKLVLFCAATQRFYLPNETATYVWLRLDEASPDAIAQELHERFSVPLAEARSDVWDTVARWAHDGLVDREGAPAGVAPPKAVAQRAPAGPQPSTAAQVRVRVLGRTWLLGFPSSEEMRALVSPLADLAVESSSHDHWIAIERSTSGLRLRSSEGDRAECRDLLEVPPLLRRWILAATRTWCPSFVAVPGVALVAREPGRSIVLVGPEAGGSAAAAALLLARGYVVVASGAVLLDETTLAPRPLPLALEISELDFHDASASAPELASLPAWTLPSELAAKYLRVSPFSSVAPPVSALVLVRRTSRDVPATLRVIDGLAALQELTRQGMSTSPPLDQDGAGRLLEWLERMACFELELGELRSAAEVIP